MLTRFPLPWRGFLCAIGLLSVIPTTALAAEPPCDASKFPCEPVITGSFGSKMPTRPTSASRSWVVVCTNPSSDSECDYSSLHQAYNAFVYNYDNGDRKIRTIRVKPGTFNLVSGSTSIRLGANNRNGTSASPLALVAFYDSDPDNPNDPNRPTLQAGCFSESNCSSLTNGYDRELKVNGDWWLIEGFKLRQGKQMLFLDSEHTTVRNNLIEDVVRHGILMSQRSQGYALIENNRFEDVSSNQQHHGVYITNGQSSGISCSNAYKYRKDDIVIRHNRLKDIGGSALQFNGSDSNSRYRACFNGSFSGTSVPQDDGIHGVVIENNIISSARAGIVLYRFVFSSRITHNSLVFRETDNVDFESSLLQIRNSAYNVIANNFFYSDSNNNRTIIGYKETSEDPSNTLNVVDHNVWCVRSNSDYSWDYTGQGASAGETWTGFTQETDQGSNSYLGWIDFAGNPCADGSFSFANTTLFTVGGEQRGLVADVGAPALANLDFNEDGNSNGGDRTSDPCPSQDFDFTNRTPGDGGCDAGAHTYRSYSPPPPPVSPPNDDYAKRINTGGSAVNTGGASWEGNCCVSGNSYSQGTSYSIGGTSMDPLYRVRRRSSQNRERFTYSISVPDGYYNVRLHFSDLDGYGDVFHVIVEGEPAKLNLDLLDEVGLRNAYVTEVNDLAITDGALNVELVPEVYRAHIAGIEILGAGAGVNAALMDEGWNLTGLPLEVSDSSYESVFNGEAISQPFTFSNGSYDASSSLTPGQGYWIRFGTDDPVTVSGTPITTLTINVKKGWNLISSIACSVPISDIDKSPSGLQRGDFFGFTEGAYIAETDGLKPWRGYWINVDRNGSFTLTCS